MYYCCSIFSYCISIAEEIFMAKKYINLHPVSDITQSWYWRGVWPSVSTYVYYYSIIQDSKTLYSGSKKGVIYSHDLRAHPTPSATFTHPAGVCSMRLSSDDRYLCASDYNSHVSHVLRHSINLSANSNQNIIRVHWYIWERVEYFQLYLRLVFLQYKALNSSCCKC